MFISRVFGGGLPSKSRALLLMLLLTCGCENQTNTGGAPDGATATSGGDYFEDVAARVGLDFAHMNGRCGEFYFNEIAGSGCAFFDYDNDGDLDVYMIQCRIPEGHDASELLDPAPPPPHHDRLFRNELRPSGQLKFTDVTRQAGLTGTTEYGMGAAVGDYDNDGNLDLYVTNFGPNHLFRNNGDGTFADVTERSGTNDTRWSSSATFVDVNRDGYLDLFVCTYVDFTYANHKKCYGATSARDYCGPLSYERSPDILFLNKRNGTFEDITARSGIAEDCGGALGVVCADFDGDHWVDIYVANDALPNQLWKNSGRLTFKNDALMSGVAMNDRGAAEASMGVSSADFDADGDMDIFITHLTEETNTLYENDGKGYFNDATVRRKLAASSHEFTGFGTGFLDIDNDGWLDLFCANGAVKTILAKQQLGDNFPLAQRNQLFRNEGNGQFTELAATGAMAIEEVSRGAAFGDVDNDGDTDILLNNNNGRARLLLNQVGQQRSWIGVEVFATERTHAFGARVERIVPGKPSRWYRLEIAGSYCSSNDARIVIGLDRETSPQTLRVHWDDGSTETFQGLETKTYHKLYRGKGSS